MQNIIETANSEEVGFLGAWASNFAFKAANPNKIRGVRHHLFSAQRLYINWRQRKLCQRRRRRLTRNILNAVVCMCLFGGEAEAFSPYILCAAPTLEYFIPCTQWRVVHDKKGIITHTHSLSFSLATMFPSAKRMGRHKALSKNPRRIERKKNGNGGKGAFAPDAHTKTNKHDPKQGRAHNFALCSTHRVCLSCLRHKGSGNLVENGKFHLTYNSKQICL
jgi:hypothetical protein